MSFNSTTFVFFLVVVYFVHWASVRRPRANMWFLLAASCAFYMSWNAIYILLLLFSAGIDYWVALYMQPTRPRWWRRTLLGVSLVSNLGLLAYFKYTNFIAETAVDMARFFGMTDSHYTPFHVILPVGISFYTFQTLSYTIDVYRGELAVCRSFPKFFLFVTFFPQLVAGPIVRADYFLPQLDRPPVHDDRRCVRALFLILGGMFKKVVLADVIALQVVQPVFGSPDTYGALGVVIGTWGALFQFYLDFSAYSDIAIGAAALLGYDLPLNFNRPFLAQSISEFWRRWHISLSSWLRDYVFLRLGGRGRNKAEFFFNVLLTMVLSGLWHGAGWNYVLWGVMHGFFTFIGSLFRKAHSQEEVDARPLWQKVLRRAFIFNLVSLSMLFFRNGTIAEGKRGIDGTLHMLSMLGDWAPAQATLSWLGIGTLGLAAITHFAPDGWHRGLLATWERLPAFAQALILALFTGIISAVAYQQTPFVYFQF